MAGIIGLLNASPQTASAELGYIILLPQFHGTSLVNHAIALLLRYCLELPSETNLPNALGLRRVQWQAHKENAASVKVAERMGFKKEGVV